MEYLPDTTVRKIVSTNIRTADVFTKHGIDFCCNGGITLEQACKQQKVDLQFIIEELNQSLTLPQNESFEDMRLDELVTHIEKVHHSYVRKTIPKLSMYLSKLCQLHGEGHPELIEVNRLFEQSAHALLLHLTKEEEVLFPYIQALSASQRGKFSPPIPEFKHLENPINLMESEHEVEGTRFKKIATLANGYEPPEDACQTYRIAFKELKEFEKDLYRHIHLENNILFPRALTMYANTITNEKGLE